MVASMQKYVGTHNQHNSSIGLIVSAVTIDTTAQYRVDRECVWRRSRQPFSVDYCMHVQYTLLLRSL